MAQQSLKDTVLDAMRRDSKHWKSYYLDASRVHFDLQYSLSDRIRYYWNTPEVTRACAQLLRELESAGLPLTLVSQYLPVQHAAIRDGRLTSDPRDIVLDGILQVLRHYARACNPTPNGSKD
jgi:D-tagatose-1,6-bisphosphate aldolase subunit GatZ/KbaZ